MEVQGMKVYRMEVQGVEVYRLTRKAKNQVELHSIAVELKSTAVELESTAVEGKSTAVRWVCKRYGDISKNATLLIRIIFKNNDL